MWCESASANFGEVAIPASFNATELLSTSDGPALMCSENSPDIDITVTPSGFNCEPLNDNLQVRWAVEGEDIMFELVGVVSETDYMGFGPSGSTTNTSMDGADPVIADSFGGTYRARDFYMNKRSQCSGGNGVCPDTERAGAVNDVRSVSGERVLGVTLVRYTKSLIPNDFDVTAEAKNETDQLPISVVPGNTTFVVWAIGPVSPDTGLPQFHTAFPREKVEIEFGRDVVDNCKPLSVEPVIQADSGPFQIPILQEVTEIFASIGPSGGDRGYSGITCEESIVVVATAAATDARVVVIIAITTGGPLLVACRAPSPRGTYSTRIIPPS